MTCMECGRATPRVFRPSPGDPLCSVCYVRLLVIADHVADWGTDE